MLRQLGFIICHGEGSVAFLSLCNIAASDLREQATMQATKKQYGIWNQSVCSPGGLIAFFHNQF